MADGQIVATQAGRQRLDAVLRRLSEAFEQPIPCALLGSGGGKIPPLRGG